MGSRKKNLNAAKSTQPSSTKSSAGSSGADRLKKNDPSARSFADSRQHTDLLKFWEGIGAQVNDNAHAFVKKQRKFKNVLVLGLLFGIASGMNSSAIATQVVLHSPDAALSAAMDVSPDALATILNQMDVGE